MESDLAAIACLIVLGVMLTCACTYLCTEVYALITGIGRPSRRPPRPRYTRRDTMYSTNSDATIGPPPILRSTSTPTANPAPPNVSTSTTTVLTEREIVRTETQHQQHANAPTPPPPLPPRATILTPWTLVPTHTLSHRGGRDVRASQLITIRQRRDEDENFQLPPRPVSMAVHFRNQASPQAYPNPHFISELSRPARPRISASASSTRSNTGCRQTIANFGNFGFGPAIWVPEHIPDDSEVDLPPTYEEAMEMRLQVEDSTETQVNANNN